MIIKFLHLNIQGGRKIDEVRRYILKNDFDIIQLQEVTDGFMSTNGLDIFEYIKTNLGYEGVLAKSMKIIKAGKDAYFGNATFYKPEIVVEDKKVIWLKYYEEYIDPVDDRDPEFIKLFPHNALALKLRINDKSFWAVNTHLAWGPNPMDEPYKIDQAKKLEKFLRELKDPFVLSGDFNVTMDSVIVKSFDQLGTNHARVAGLTNTLNPHLHRAAKELFPGGLAVDYIYTTKGIEASNFLLISEPDLSDHLGLSIEIII